MQHKSARLDRRNFAFISEPALPAPARPVPFRIVVVWFIWIDEWIWAGRETRAREHYRQKLPRTQRRSQFLRMRRAPPIRQVLCKLRRFELVKRCAFMSTDGLARRAFVCALLYGLNRNVGTEGECGFLLTQLSP